MEEIRYAGVVPLIGGMMIGAEKALGKKAEYIVSYPAFASNDQYLKDYWKDVPFHLLNPETNQLGILDLPQVDFVSALCPCAGLSQLNSAKSRGANAPQNDWMYKSTEFVLEHVKPKVLWGENAPGLYGSVGAPVSTHLRKIGDQFGYSFSMVRTDSILHGIPQRRPRTFYFFWNSETAPILNWYKRTPISLQDHLAEVKDLNDPEELKEKTESLLNDPFYQFMKKEYGNDWRKVVLKHSKSLMDVIMMEGKIGDFLQYVESIGNQGAFNRATHAKNKRELGKNYWDFSPFLPGDSTGALNGARMCAIHPTEDRYFTTKEFGQMMCLPKDMTLPVESPGKIFQNVPANTVADWTSEVVKFCRGELEMSDQRYLKTMCHRRLKIRSLHIENLFLCFKPKLQ